MVGNSKNKSDLVIIVLVRGVTVLVSIVMVVEVLAVLLILFGHYLLGDQLVFVRLTLLLLQSCSCYHT